MTGATVDVYRNGLFLKNTANTGGYTYSTTFTGQASYRFKVCEVGSSSCSNEAGVKFSGWTSPPIPLNVAGWTEPTRKLMALTWTGASGTTVDVYRNGRFLRNTANTGKHTNSVLGLTAATYTYKVCQKGTTTCSHEATVTFAGGPLP